MSRKNNFRLYRVWDGIIQRCCNPNAKNYHNYGGRGISVCDEWRTDFSVFEEYCISNGWKEGLQIDRVNNNGNYCPGNIRFVTQAENLRNKRTNHMITFNGETLCAADWCERFSIDDSTLWRRLTSGWSVEDALTKPKQKRTYGKMDGGVNRIEIDTVKNGGVNDAAD